MDPREIAELIRQSIADAEVEVDDFTGTGDHFEVRVVSSAFEGKTLLEQHRLVHQAVALALADGRIHALHIKTQSGRLKREETSGGGNFHVIQ